MNINELDEFFTFMIDKYNSKFTTDVERAMVRMVRLQEELGELAEVVFSKVGIGRKEKLDAYKHEDLEKEIGDVFISLLGLAKALDVKPDVAIRKTLDKVASRIGYEKTDQWKLENIK